MREQTMKCHACGSTMVRGVKVDTVTYKKSSTTVQQPAWYCTGCDEAVVDGDDMQVHEDALRSLGWKPRRELGEK